MKNKKFILFVIIVLIIANVFQFVLNYSNIKGNLVQDEETAVLIAQAVLRAVDPELLEPLNLGVGYYYRTFDVTYSSFRRAWVVSANLPRVEGVYLHGWNI